MAEPRLRHLLLAVLAALTVVIVRTDDIQKDDASILASNTPLGEGDTLDETLHLRKEKMTILERAGDSLKLKSSHPGKKTNPTLAGSKSSESVKVDLETSESKTKHKEPVKLDEIETPAILEVLESAKQDRIGKPSTVNTQENEKPIKSLRMSEVLKPDASKPKEQEQPKEATKSDNLKNSQTAGKLEEQRKPAVKIPAKQQKYQETKQVDSPKLSSSNSATPRTTKPSESTNNKQPKPSKKDKNNMPKSKFTNAGEDIKWNTDTNESYNSLERPLRILAVIPFNARSHFIMFSSLFRALAARGHKVDVLSHYPLDDPPPNYHDLSVKGSYESWEDAVDMELIDSLNPLTDVLALWYESLDVCSKVLEHPVAKKLLDSTERYDLVITELFGSECMAGFGYRFGVPTIGLISSIAPPSTLDRLGNPDHPAYIANYFLPYTEHMTFWQRLVNTFYGWAFRRLKYLMSDRYTDVLARSYFGPDLPSTSELARNTSLILVNSHFSSHQARPMVPGVVEVGGLHVEEPKSLPEDLERFVSESEAGVVVFSLGTMVRVGSWEEERLQALWGALGALPQRVLLKSKDSLPDAPPNVRVQPWLPQLDLLCHPKVVAFITHGGLMGTQEAIWAGVPMLGIPMFADQHINLATYASKGVAIVVEYHEMTRERLSDALKQLTQDPGFRERAAALSRLFRDRPRRPVDEAVWWVEYVVRHGGAQHLRSAAADLPLYQLLLLDVIGALLLAAGLGFAFIWFALANVYRFIGFGSKAARGRRPLPATTNSSSGAQRKRYTKTKQH